MMAFCGFQGGKRRYLHELSSHSLYRYKWQTTPLKPNFCSVRTYGLTRRRPQTWERDRIIECKFGRTDNKFSTTRHFEFGKDAQSSSCKSKAVPLTSAGGKVIECGIERTDVEFSTKRSYGKDAQSSSCKSKAVPLTSAGGKVIECGIERTDVDYSTKRSYGKDAQYPSCKSKAVPLTSARGKVIECGIERTDVDFSTTRSYENDYRPKLVPRRPQLPNQETARGLLVESVDFNIKENIMSNNTAEYECTKDRFVNGCEHRPAELVVRRGNFMKFTVAFDRPYSKEKHDLKLCFTIGKRWGLFKGTQAEFMLNEHGRETYEPDQWGAYLRRQSGNDIDIMIHIPATCIIGEWTFTVKTIWEGKDETGKETKLVAEYQHDDDIKIIFNPWCKDDEVYMERSHLLNEYILNESGCVYRGTAWNYSPKPWNFGQFEDEVLDICLYLLRRAFNVSDKMAPGMADPIEVSRKLVAMINSNDDDGVIVGCWSDDYSNGVAPTKWIGSVPILRKFMAEGPVRYGQCWVYACVATTVFRCLGIPCRTVTNFSSAHDSDCTNVIEWIYDAKADAELCLIPEMSESIWNFHVWNEAWFSRPDLGKKEYYGWQVVDATPQEESGGVMTCGPCPVSAIKEGQVDIGFDTAFVFSEVNADVVAFKLNAHGSTERIRTDKTRVGKKISTKNPDGKPFVFDVSDRNRLDLTNEYKYPEGSTQERAAVRLAYQLAKKHHRNFIPYPTSVTEEEKFQIKMKHRNDIMIGQELAIDIMVKNNSCANREIRKTCLNILPMTYDGQTGPSLTPRKFDGMTISPDEEVTLSIVVNANEYYRQLTHQAHLRIQAVCALAPESGCGSDEAFMKTHNFIFRRPVLEITGPATGMVGKDVEFKVSFQNPLGLKLTNCEISMDSPGFRNIEDQKQRDVRPNGPYCAMFCMVPKRCGTFQVTFTFESKELDDISGSQTIVTF